MAHTPSIIPQLFYTDGQAALKFLHKAFGLSVVQSFEGANRALLHAELSDGNGVIIIASTDQPKGPSALYLVVGDVDAHHARAAENGAQIIDPPHDTDRGTRRYRARDPEGHEWSFGTYQPSTEPPTWG